MHVAVQEANGNTRVHWQRDKPFAVSPPASLVEIEAHLHILPDFLVIEVIEVVVALPRLAPHFLPRLVDAPQLIANDLMTYRPPHCCLTAAANFVQVKRAPP